MATLGEYLGAGSGTTKLLLHLNGSSADSSGNGNNGTDTNITYSQANGKFGQGAGFNGSSSKITLGTRINLNGLNYTLNCWVKPANTTGEKSIFSKFWDGSTRGYDFGISGDKIEIQTGESGGIQHTTGSVITANIWQLITWVYNGTDYRIYLNGNLIDIWATSYSVSNNNANNLIGDFTHTSLHQYYNGTIDELFLDVRAWSASEVKKYYTNSRGFYATL